MKKYGLIFVLLLKKDCPENWPTAFADLLGFMKEMFQDVNSAAKSINLFVRILLTFDEEVVERSEANKVDIEVSSKLKDIVRA